MNVRLVDSGEMLQNPNLKQIKILPKKYEATLLSHLVNALPVVPTEVDIGKFWRDFSNYHLILLEDQLEMLRNQLGQRMTIGHIGQKDGKGIVEFKFKQRKTFQPGVNFSALKPSPYSGLYDVKFQRECRVHCPQIAWPRWATEHTKQLTVK